VDPTDPALVTRRAVFGGGADPLQVLIFEFDPLGQPTLATTFGTTAPDGTVHIAVAVADVNGDGTDDVLFQQQDPADPGQDTVFAQITTCSGAEALLAVTEFDPGAYDRVFGAADLDGDGDDDLVSVQLDGVGVGSLRTALSDGTGGYGLGGLDAGALALPAALDRWSVSRTPTDLDGDGIPDLMECGWTPPSGASICNLVPGLGDGTFGPPTFAVLLADPVDSVATADFTGDGVADLLLGFSDGGEAWLLAGTGTGGFGLPSLAFDLDARAEVTAADVDGDAFADIIALTYDAVVPTDRVIVTLLGDGAGGFTVGGTFASTSNAPDPGGPDAVAATPP
jgi:hypothetical protein